MIRRRLVLTTTTRVIFFLVILIATVAFQLKQASFFNTESVFPIYGLLALQFLLTSIYLFFFEYFSKKVLAQAALFAFDGIFITALILVTGSPQAVFLFLYLVNIILCAYVLGRRGGFWLAVFTSFCFSFVLILGPELQGQTLYYAVSLNNLAFFAVAALSGYVSEQISHLEDLNKLIVDNMGTGLITISPAGKVTLANSAAQKILQDENLVSRDLNSLFSGMLSLLKRQPTLQREMDFFVNSRRLTLGFNVSPLLHDGKNDGFIILFDDRTEMVRLELQARRQEKLAAVGKLAAGIAHEIRNPLASISGSIELLKSTLTVKTPDELKLMEIGLKEISRLNALITEFLEFVKPEAAKTDLFEIDPILGEVLDMVKVNPNLPKNVEQIRKLNARAFVRGDQDKLKQVFLNLVINAYQSMNDSALAKLTVTTEAEEGLAIVRFKDTGSGMAPETLKHLFEPFFTTKPKGTGLGLALAYKILETHHAQIFVESREGQGTEFTIQFHQEIKQGANIDEGQNTRSG